MRTLTALLALSLALPAAGQDGRGRTDPGLTIETPGRTGPCDALLFTPDGRHLLAAGDDKVVRVLPVTPAGLDADGGRVLRWSVFREQRGAIYAAALDPAGARVAVAGFGQITAAVAVIDVASGRVLHALTKHPDGTAHTVWSLAWLGPDRVAVGRNDGTVLVWDVGGAVAALGRHAGPPANAVRWLGVVNGRLHSAADDGTVLRWADAGLQPVGRFDRLQAPVRSYALSADRATLAAGGDHKSYVGVMTLADGAVGYRKLPADRYPTSLAFHPRDGRLAVGTYHLSAAGQPADGRFWNVGPDSRVYLFDGGRVTASVAVSNAVDRVAFSPDGGLLAVAGGDNHEVALYRVGAAVEPLGPPVAGPGRGLWGVAVSEDDPDELGVRDVRDPAPAHPNERGAGRWRVFDLGKTAWDNGGDPAAGFKPVRPITTLDGWSVDYHDKLRVWEAVRRDGGKELARHKLTLTREDDRPTCYTFLRGPAGQSRIAVGHYWGASVFELADAGVRRVRWFTGHAGPVTALAPREGPRADRHTFLYTASSDQTVAAWNLGDWPHHPELGAAFALKAEGLTVEAVAPGSPAWEMGLEAGDRVVGLLSEAAQARYSAGDRYFYDPQARAAAWVNFDEAAKRQELAVYPNAATAERALDLLRRPVPLTVTVVFRLTKAGEVKASLTRLRQRPLWKFFPSFEPGRPPEWVLWLWRDYHYATSGNGDARLGWQLSGGVGETPRAYRAEQFRRRFHRPERVARALRDAAAEPDRVSLATLEPPAVRLDVAARAVTGPVAVTVTATPQGELPEHRPSQVVLWLNDRKMHTFARGEPGVDLDRPLAVAVPAEEFRTGTNVLLAQAFNSDKPALRSRGDSPAVELVKGDAGSVPRGTLYVLAFGIRDYTSPDRPADAVQLSPLQFADWDAEVVANLFKDAGGGRLFGRVVPVVVTNRDVTRERILGEVEKVAAAAGPDDRLVLFFSGHGFAREGAYRQSVPGTFALVTHNFAYRATAPDADHGGVTAAHLEAALGRVRCRKLILLDACHAAGAFALRPPAGGGDPARELRPSAAGPVVIASSAFGEESQESVGLGQGAFTQAVVDAVARWRDGAGRGELLRLDGFADRVGRRVPEVFRETPDLRDKRPYPTPVAARPRLERGLPWFEKR